jgi:hypothetical protein
MPTVAETASVVVLGVGAGVGRWRGRRGDVGDEEVVFGLRVVVIVRVGYHLDRVQYW